MDVPPTNVNVQAAVDLIEKFFGFTQSESDRGVALIVVSMLDSMLGELHAAYIGKNVGEGAKAIFDKLASNNDPLSTLAGKIEMARCFGLIGETEYRDLNVMRRLRNRVAHDLVRFAFADMETERLISQLQTAKIGQGIVEMPLPDLHPLDLLCNSFVQTITTAPKGKCRPRAHFVVHGMLLYVLLQKKKAHLPEHDGPDDWFLPPLGDISNAALPLDKVGEWFLGKRSARDRLGYGARDLNGFG